MVKLPGFDNRQSVETNMRLMRNFGAADDTGRALSQAGATLGRVGAQVMAADERFEAKVEQERKRTDTLEAEHGLIRFQTEAERQLKLDAENLTGPARGFYDETMTRLDKTIELHTSGLPETVKGEYAVKYAHARERLAGTIAGVEAGARRTYAAGVMTEKRDQMASATSSGLMDTSTAGVEIDRFVGSLGYTGPKAEALKLDLYKAADDGTMRRRIAENPDIVMRDLARYTSGSPLSAPAPGAAPRSPIHDKIIMGAEAAGIPPALFLMAARAENDKFDPNDKNPKSSARGMFGFIDANFKEFGVAPTTDPDMQIQLAGMKYRKVLASLKANDIPVTPGSFWGSHFLGEAGYRSMVRAAATNPNATFLEVYRQFGDKMARDAVVNNGGMLAANMPVSQVLRNIEDYATRRYNEVTPLVGGARTAPDGTGADPTASGATTVPYSGPVAVGGETLLGLTPADIPKYYADARNEVIKRNEAAFKKAQKDGVEQRTIPFNAFTAEDRRALDEVARDTPERINRLLTGEARAMAEVSREMRDYGYLARPYAETAASMVASADPSRRRAGYKILAEAEVVNPTDGLKHSSISGDIATQVKMYAALVAEANLSPDEAIARVDRQLTTDFKVSVARDKDRFKGDADRLTLGQITSYNEAATRGWIFSSTSTGTDRVGESLLAQFKRHYEFYRTDGADDQTAKARANADIRQSYGATAIVGERQYLTPFPPERVLPKIDGSLSWAATQTVDHVNAALAANDLKFTVTKDKVHLIGTAETGRSVAAGRPAFYEVWYSDDKDRWQSLPGGIRFDPSSVAARRAVEASPPPAVTATPRAAASPPATGGVAAARAAAAARSEVALPEHLETVRGGYTTNRVFTAP